MGVGGLREDMGDPGMEGLDGDDGVMEDEGDGLRALCVGTHTHTLFFLSLVINWLALPAD